MPGHPWTTGFFVVACASIVAATVWNSPVNSAIGFAILLAGVPAFLYWQAPAMSGRVLQSEYMHWAKTQTPARYNLASSEVPHFRMDRSAIDPAELELDGASRYRYPPLREAIAAKCGVTPDRVVMADGTSMANMLAMAALIAPGDEVLDRASRLRADGRGGALPRRRGAPLHPRRARDFALDPAAVEAALTDRTRLIVLTNLHNPTGNLADAGDCSRSAHRRRGPARMS